MSDSCLKFVNGKFRIMLVGDPHEGPDLSAGHNADAAADLDALLNAACDKLRPDLVVYMGDNARGDTEDELRSVIRRITSPAVKRNIPFGFVIGNHDLQAGVNSLGVHYEIYSEQPGCIFTFRDVVNDERGDYLLPVMSSDGIKRVFDLWFMYSGDAAEKKYFSTYDFVRDSQIKWYEQTAADVREQNGVTVPAMLFQHIPVPEEYRLLRRVSPEALLFGAVMGINGRSWRCYAPDRNTGFKGWLGEAPGTPDYNNGQFESWKKTGDIIAAFFGHDHLNDFTGTVDGILLGQCKLAGFRQYGDGMRQSVRIIDLNEDSPYDFNTRMCYYRELVGNKCRSIHGVNKYLPDKISTRLEGALKIAAAAAVPALAVILCKKAHGKKSKK